MSKLKTYIILDEPPSKLLWTGEAASYSHATYKAWKDGNKINGQQYRVYEVAEHDVTPEFIAEQRRLANEANRESAA